MPHLERNAEREGKSRNVAEKGVEKAASCLALGPWPRCLGMCLSYKLLVIPLVALPQRPDVTAADPNIR